MLSDRGGVGVDGTNERFPEIQTAAEFAELRQDAEEVIRLQMCSIKYCEYALTSMVRGSVCAEPL